MSSYIKNQTNGRKSPEPPRAGDDIYCSHINHTHNGRERVRDRYYWLFGRVQTTKFGVYMYYIISEVPQDYYRRLVGKRPRWTYIISKRKRGGIHI